MNEVKPRQITVAEMAPHIHNYAANENKTEKIFAWLKAWIINSLATKKIKEYDLLPSKAELSYHIGVSKGTLQTAIRQLENMGYVESKQKIGTYIKNTKNTTPSNKLTSKREVAIEQLKKYILDGNYKKGDSIPSIHTLSKELQTSNATMRLAVMQLIISGILVQKERKYILTNIDFTNTMISQETLVSKITHKMKKYIQKELQGGDKIPSTEHFAKLYNVSIKTVYDAMKTLVKEGILYSRRGNYGTIVLDNNKDKISSVPYCYEKIELKIKTYIIEHCKTGDKLPSIDVFAKKFGTSGKTVKKAIDNLIQDGYLTSTRGRYGGTFVLDIPQKNKKAYKWLAINMEYIPEMEN